MNTGRNSGTQLKTIVHSYVSEQPLRTQAREVLSEIMHYTYYYHYPTDKTVARVDVQTTERTHRSHLAGFSVSGSIMKFSVDGGKVEKSSVKAFDKRDSEQRAIQFYLSRAPLIGGMNQIDVEEFDKWLAEYRRERAQD